METVSIIGLDLAKDVFQADASGSTAPAGGSATRTRALDGSRHTACRASSLVRPIAGSEVVALIGWWFRASA